MRSKLKIAFIGFGAYAQKAYLPWIKENQFLQIVGISCDLELLNNKVENHLAVPYIDDPKSMIEDLRPDLVIITTPHAMHYEQTSLAIANRIHVMVEKPPACNSRQIRELYRLSQRANVKVAIGVERRYQRIFKLIKSVLESGRIGKICSVNYFYNKTNDDNYEKTWRNSKELSCGGILIDGGYHIIDLLLWLFPYDLTSLSGIIAYGERNVEMRGNFLATLERDIVISASLSYSQKYQTNYELMNIVGTDGQISYSKNKHPGGPKPQQLQITDKSGISKDINDFLDSNDLDYAPLKNLIESVKTNSPIIADIKSSIATIDFIEKLYETAQYT